MWFQKARVDEIRDGDRNTKYFHTSTIIRRRFNRVDTLMSDTGDWCSNQDEIKTMIMAHFKQLFSPSDEVEAGPLNIATEFPRMEPANF